MRLRPPRSRPQRAAASSGTRREHEDDLAALIEALADGPVHLVGTSFGGSIALGLAARRPELVRSLVVHEPPLLSLVAEDPEIQPQLMAVATSVGSVWSDWSAATRPAPPRQFVEEVAFGPGAWEQLPPPLRETMIDSAPAFVAEQSGPAVGRDRSHRAGRHRLPGAADRGRREPALVPADRRRGSPRAIEGAEVHTYQGAGHAPHLTHPDDYLSTVTSFLSRETVGA